MAKKEGLYMMSIEDSFNTVKGINENTAYDIFHEIATNLFSNYYLKRGNDIFYFVEIEFYYYSNKHRDTVEDSHGIKPFVYARHCDKNGQFFFHGSGVDICFAGNSNEPQNGYGGILIRSLLLNDNYIVTGPWDCYSTLFSYTSNDVHVQLLPKTDNIKMEVKPVSCRRKIEKSEKKYNFGNKHYAFFDPRFADGDKYRADLIRYDYMNESKKKETYYPNFEKRK